MAPPAKHAATSADFFVGRWEHNGELFEYPPQFCMRNTFIDGASARSPSFDEFFNDRLVQSCPTSQQDELLFMKETDLNVTKTESTSAGSSEAPCEDELGDSTPAAARMRWSDEDQEYEPGDGEAAFRPSGVSLLHRLAQQPAPSFGTALTEGPAMLPSSQGSMSHGSGRCKPCAFFHTKGCESGMDCAFCHVCAPGEKKFRKKERNEARKTRNMAASPASVFGSMARGRLPMTNGRFFNF